MVAFDLFSRGGWAVEPLRADDPQMVGSYRLISRLGAGGMGRVYLGESQGGRKVAVKLLLTEHETDPEFRQRFAREVAAARRVGGFHTAPVVDADPAADPPWMVTAYIPGPSLDAAVRASGPLDARGARALGAALAEGLAAVHACGLVHRDLKPGNIIMADDGPRIIDFGIARAADATALTSSGVIIGTFSFMSPEQVRGEHVRPTSDVFSLGSVLAYAATGRGPFDAPSLPVVIHRIASEPPDLRGISEPLQSVIAACLAKDPASRPSLANLLGMLSGAAMPPSPASPAYSQTASPTYPASHPPAPPVPPSLAATGTVAPGPVPSERSAPAWRSTPPPAHPSVQPTPQPAWRHRALLAAGGGIALSAAVVVGILVVLNTGNSGGQSPGTSAHGPQAFSVPAARGVIAVAVSDNGAAQIADGYGKASAGSWDANEDRRILDLSAQDGSQVYAVAYSPNGSVVAVGNSVGDIYFWNTVTGKNLGRFSEPTAGQGITSIVYSGNGRFLAAADADGAAYVWNTATGALTTFPADPKNAGSMEVAINRDGTLLATGDGNGQIHIWDVATRKNVRSISDVGGLPFFSLSMSPDGKLLASSDGIGDSYLWSTATGNRVATMSRMNGQPSVEAVQFSPDGKILAVGNGAGGNILLWNTIADKVQATLPEQGGTGGYDLAFSPDGKTLAAVDGPDGHVMVRVWPSLP